MGGGGARGQIGNGLTNDVSSPTSASLGGDVTLGLALSSRSACVILSDRTVKCWGEGALGENAQGYLSQQSTVPSLQVTPEGVDRIFSSGQGFAAVDDRTLGEGGDRWWVWGKNAPTQLGGGVEQYLATTPWMVQLPPRLASGQNHSCYVRRDGKVFCWGSNSSGQLGRSGGDSASPVEVTGLTDAYTIAAGASHTCAAIASGDVKCWGHDGAVNYLSTPTVITHDILTANGALTGDNATYNTPLEVSRISAGFNHTCLNRAFWASTAGAVPDGSVTPRMHCWGLNGVGQLLTNNTTTYGQPGKDVVSTRLNTHYYLEIPYGGGDRSCFVANGGIHRCGGENSQYELNLSDSTDKLTASTVSRLGRPLAHLAMGANHTCGALSDFSNRVACWGLHTNGQLGDGSEATIGNSTGASKTLSYISGSREIYPGILGAGYHHTCVGLRSGAVECWGSNSDGQLGNGSSGGVSTSPVSAGSMSGEAREISGGEFHTCVRTTTAVQCFGKGNLGQLGNGATSSVASPVTVSLSRQ